MNNRPRFTDEEYNRFMRNIHNDPEYRDRDRDRPDHMGVVPSIAFILMVLGLTLLFVGLLALIPEVFTKGLFYGMSYSGLVMTLLGFCLWLIP